MGRIIAESARWRRGWRDGDGVASAHAHAASYNDELSIPTRRNDPCCLRLSQERRRIHPLLQRTRTGADSRSSRSVGLPFVLRFRAVPGFSLTEGRDTARFGDTAANVGILALLSSNPALKNLPSFVKTALASTLSAAFRMILSPLDALKTTMQTEGDKAIPLLRTRIRNHGIGTLVRSASPTDIVSHSRDQYRNVLTPSALVGWRFRDRCCQLCRLLPVVRDVQLSLGSAASFPQPRAAAPPTSFHVCTISSFRMIQADDSPTMQWFLRFRRLGHGVELATCAQDLPPSQREECIVSNSTARGREGVRSERAVWSRTGDAYSCQRTAGTDVLGAVEAVSRIVGADGIDIYPSNHPRLLNDVMSEEYCVSARARELVATSASSQIRTEKFSSLENPGALMGLARSTASGSRLRL